MRKTSESKEADNKQLNMYEEQNLLSVTKTLPGIGIMLFP